MSTPLRFALALALALLAAPGLADDPPLAKDEERVEAEASAELETDEEAIEEPADEDPGSPLVAAGWCVARNGEAEEGAPGCDAGLGVALYRWRRLSLVAVIGAETVGSGVAWVAYRPEGGGPIVAIALGAVARYDTAGVDVGELYPALGATFSFGGRR
jgi:hypothetical protein